MTANILPVARVVDEYDRGQEGLGEVKVGVARLEFQKSQIKTFISLGFIEACQKPFTLLH